MMSRPAPYTEGLRFQSPAGETADVDETMIAAAMMKQMAGKVGDVLGGVDR